MLFMEKLPAFGDWMGHMELFFGNIVAVIVLLACLGAATYTDVTELKIPNRLNALIVIFRVALIPVMGISYYNLLGFAFCFGLFLFVGVITYTSMGGDIKCVGAIGFFLGLHTSVLVILAACFLAIVYGIIRKLAKRGRYFPFAPFFCAGYIAVTICYAVALIL